MRIKALDKEFKQQLKMQYLKRKAKLKRKFLHTNFVVDTYTLEELITRDFFYIFEPKNQKNLEYLQLIKNDAIISMGSTYENKDELIFLSNLTKIFKKLEKHNRTYNIEIVVNNYETLKQTGLLNLVNNINLIIKNYSEKFTKEEYQNIEEQLNNLVKPIKESQLSPYEKYLAVYNIVKKFKPYKDNPNNPRESRSLKYILNNEYIVCVGYAKLLKVLLDKVEIPSMIISVIVDTSYDNGFTMECIPTDLYGHERNIIKIDDNKYGIHGIYLADATWDNSIKYDLYNNSTMTFDKIKEAYRLERLEIVELLLDFHHFKEFSDKINYYLKREIKTSSKDSIKEKIITEYHLLYSRIMSILEELDHSKYQEFTKKYQDKISKKKNPSLKEIENIYSEFLTEYAQYIIPLSNNKIDNALMFEAISNVKKEIDKYTEEELKEWEQVVISENEKNEEEKFPYIYNPNETRINFLESKSKTKTKSRDKEN